jgi:hypothetical protein
MLLVSVERWPVSSRSPAQHPALNSNARGTNSPSRGFSYRPHTDTTGHYSDALQGHTYSISLPACLIGRLQANKKDLSTNTCSRTLIDASIDGNSNSSCAEEALYDSRLDRPSMEGLIEIKN